MTFFTFFLHISFSIATEAMYTEFGDPKSIMAEFHFSSALVKHHSFAHAKRKAKEGLESEKWLCKAKSGFAEC